MSRYGRATLNMCVIQAYRETSGITSNGRQPAAVKTIDVEARVRGQPNEEEFRRAVQKYFKRIAKAGLEQGSYVSLAKIGALLLQGNSVQDYEGLTLNGAAANVPLASAELPSLGRVVLHG